MSESDKADRRSRLVTALGIATVVLFSANLLAMITKHVWPGVSEKALFHAQDEAVAEAGDHDIEFHALSEFNHRHRHSHKRSPHRIIIRKPHAATGTFSFDSKSFEADLNRLERDMEREMVLLNRDFSSVASSKPFVYSITKGDGDVTLKFNGEFEFDGAETFADQKAGLNHALQLARDLSAEIEISETHRELIEEFEETRARVQEFRVRADRAGGN